MDCWTIMATKDIWASIGSYFTLEIFQKIRETTIRTCIYLFLVFQKHFYKIDVESFSENYDLKNNGYI